MNAKIKTREKKSGVIRYEALVMAYKCVMLEHTQNKTKFSRLLHWYINMEQTVTGSFPLLGCEC